MRDAHDLRAVIADYLALLQEEPGKGADAQEQDILRLVQVLDRVIQCYHATAGGPLGAEGKPPDPDLPALYAQAKRRFPMLGYYPAVDVTVPFEGTRPNPFPKAEILVGDAFDDLADIAMDLQEVVWRWENTDRHGAIWFFRWTYQFHLGQHLLSLRRYLHAVLYAN